MGLRIVRSVLEALRAAAAAAAPAECCGLLLGREELIEQALPAVNVATDPRRHFEIDPQALVDAHRAQRAGGRQVLGYYHSHPFGLAAPSPVDQAQASGDRRVWAIAGMDGVTFWRDDEEGYAPLSYAVLDG